MRLDFALWILHKSQNRLSRCRLGVQLDLCIFGMTSFLLLPFVSCQAGIFSSFLPYPLRLLPPVLSLLGAKGWTCAQDCNDLLNWSPTLYEFLLTLQSIAASIGTSNFFSAFSTVSLNSASSGSIKINASQLSRIVEPLFFDCRVVLFFLLSCLSHIFHISGHKMIWPSCCLHLCQPSPWTVYIRLEVFHSKKKVNWILSMLLTNLDHLQRSNNRQYGVQAIHPRSYV